SVTPSFFVSGSRRHTRFSRGWSSDVCSSDLMRSTLRYSATEGRAAVASRLYNAASFHSAASAWPRESGLSGSQRIPLWPSLTDRSEERRVGEGGRGRGWRGRGRGEGIGGAER